MASDDVDQTMSNASQDPNLSDDDQAELDGSLTATSVIDSGMFGLKAGRGQWKHCTHVLNANSTEAAHFGPLASRALENISAAAAASTRQSGSLPEVSGGFIVNQECEPEHQPEYKPEDDKPENNQSTR